MAHIFVSYASEDRAQAAPIVRALEAQGWEVWWDRNIPAGASFQRAIGEAIDSAECIVVLWTSHSIESEWVWEEANEGKDRNILVPVLLESVRPPLGLRTTQLIDLSDWEAGESHAEFDQFLAAIGRCVGNKATPSSAPKPRIGRKRRAGLWVSLAAAVGLIAAGFWLTTRTTAFRDPEPNSVAVLPFADMSPVPDSSNIGDSIATELLSELSQLDQLVVASRATSFAYRDADVDVREVGEKMFVAHILEGTFRRMGQHVRVTMQLVSVDDGYQIWSDVYDEVLDNSFAAEINIATKAAASIEETFGGESRPTLLLQQPEKDDPSEPPATLQNLFETAPAVDFPTFDESEMTTLGGEENSL